MDIYYNSPNGLRSSTKQLACGLQKYWFHETQWKTQKPFSLKDIKMKTDCKSWFCAFFCYKKYYWDNY